MANDTCYPNQKTPECYEAPIEDFDQRVLVSEIVTLWSSGVYVVTLG